MKHEYKASIIVRNITRITAIPIIVFGFYVILHGHLTPGGGFPGGAIVATLIALILVSFRREEVKGLHWEPFSILESLGLVAFAMLALIGIPNTFFHNFMANSNQLFGMAVPFGPNPGYLSTGGVIPLMNMAVGLEVFSALSLIVLVIFTHSKDDKND